MTKQAMFYENPVPVSSERHREWSIETPQDYRFAQDSSSVPSAAVEFAAAAGEYAIVFVGEEGTRTPVVILGIKPGENLYLDDQGHWKSRYLPAFVRRYPFVFSSREGSNEWMLCIDEKYAGCNQDGRGKRLFDINGDRTEYLKGMLKFVEDFQREARRTEAFCKVFEELELFEPMTARFNLPSGQSAALTGFTVVNRVKLNALPGDKLSELATSGALELAYLHLYSLRNLQTVAGRVIEPDPDEPSAQEAAAKPVEATTH